MCPQGKWEKVSNGLWAKSMSPFNHKLLDIRMTSSSTQTLEVSIEEGIFVILLSVLLYVLTIETCLCTLFFVHLPVHLFCRNFQISYSFFSTGHCVVECGIYSKPIISILLRWCNGNWGYTCCINSPVSGKYCD